jgi:molybdenum cofactor cytidylyltransferase
MTTPLSERLGLGARELVAIVGAGGKTTIMGILANELGSTGARVILTTTTKMGADQVSEPVCRACDPESVQAMLVPGVPLSVLNEAVGGKVAGLEPDAVGEMFLSTTVDYIIVEADGARSLSIKAPADHEPVIPDLSTTVIVVVGADAFSYPLGSVAHRMERITALTGLTEGDVITPEGAATILLHPDGGLKAIPAAARVAMVVAKVTAENTAEAERLAKILEVHPGVDHTETLPLASH